MLKYRHVVVWIASYLLVLLFVYAAVSKLLDFEGFRTELAQSPLLSAYAGLIAPAVIIAELLFTLLLCINAQQQCKQQLCNDNGRRYESGIGAQQGRLCQLGSETFKVQEFAYCSINKQKYQEVRGNPHHHVAVLKHDSIHCY